MSPGWCVRSRFEGPVVQTGRWWRLLWLSSEAARPGGLVLLLIRGSIFNSSDWWKENLRVRLSGAAKWKLQICSGINLFYFSQD